MTISSAVCFTTYPAMPMGWPTWWAVRIGLSESVPMGTERFEDMRSGATPNVLKLRNRFKMAGVNTVTNTTKMVNLQASRDRADEHFVSDSMGLQHGRAHSESAVAIGDMSACPEPTVAQQREIVGHRPVHINLGPEARNGGIVEEHQEPPILGVMRRAVSAAPSPSIVPNGGAPSPRL